MNLKHRLEKLREKNSHLLMTLRCRECGEVFSGRGDIALELIVADWTQSTGEGHHETAPDVAAILDHEHDTDCLVEVKSGLPLGVAAGIGLGSWEEDAK
jgi:hypothetical protein